MLQNHRTSALSTSLLFKDACDEVVASCTRDAFRYGQSRSGATDSLLTPHSLAIFRPNIAFLFFSDHYLMDEGEDDCLAALRSALKGRLPSSTTLIGCTGARPVPARITTPAFPAFLSV